MLDLEKSKWGGGYGVFYFSGKRILAHRWSHELHSGQPLASGQIVMHACDNRPCVNPAHLSRGSYAENTADMWSKGRQNSPALRRGLENAQRALRDDPSLYPRGERNGKSVINDKIVLEIRRLSKSMSQRKIAELLVCGKATVGGVLSGRTWSHVKDVQ